MAERGLYLELNAYKYHVFLDFREVQDDEWDSYRQLNGYLQGRGVPSVQEAMRELLLQPVQQPFRQIANPGYFRFLLDHRLDELTPSLLPDLESEAQSKLANLLDGIAFLTKDSQNRDLVLAESGRTLASILSLPLLDQRYHMPNSKRYKAAVEFLNEGLQDNETRWLTLFAFAFLSRLGRLAGEKDYENLTVSWIDEWQFGRIVSDAAREMGLPETAVDRIAGKLRLLAGQQRWFSRMGDLPPLRSSRNGWPIMK